MILLFCTTTSIAAYILSGTCSLCMFGHEQNIVAAIIKINDRGEGLGIYFVRLKFLTFRYFFVETKSGPLPTGHFCFERSMRTSPKFFLQRDECG